MPARSVCRSIALSEGLGRSSLEDFGKRRARNATSTESNSRGGADTRTVSMKRAPSSGVSAYATTLQPSTAMHGDHHMKSPGLAKAQSPRSRPLSLRVDQNSRALSQQIRRDGYNRRNFAGTGWLRDARGSAAIIGRTGQDATAKRQYGFNALASRQTILPIPNARHGPKECPSPASASRSAPCLAAKGRARCDCAPVILPSRLVTAAIIAGQLWVQRLSIRPAIEQWGWRSGGFPLGQRHDARLAQIGLRERTESTATWRTTAAPIPTIQMAPAFGVPQRGSGLGSARNRRASSTTSWKRTTAAALSRMTSSSIAML